MRISQIVEHVNTIERDIPVQEWRIDGVDVWPTVRIGLYFDLFEHANFPRKPSGGMLGKIKRIFQFGFQLLRFALSAITVVMSGKGSVGCGYCQCDAVFLDDPSYVFVDGKRYQRFCDPVIDELQKNGMTACLFSLSERAYGDTTTPTSYIWGALQWQRILNLLRVRIFPKKESVINLAGFDEYNLYVKNIGAGAQQIDREKLIKTTLSFLAMAAYFKKVLIKAAPTACFSVSYYNSYHMAFIYACRQLNIPVIDLQHGVINEFHVAYGRWVNVPKCGYNILPNYFACWDQASADYINEWSDADGYSPHQGIVFGNKFLEKMTLEHENETAGFLSFFNKIQKEKEPTKNIILTMQNKYLLMDILKDILNSAPKSVFWWIRLHPMTTMEEKQSILLGLSEISGLSYETTESSAHHLYSILPNMDVHLTLNSSVVIEALEFGVPSVICEDLGFEYYQSMIDAGDAYAARTAEEAVSMIMELTRKEKTPPHRSSDVLYKRVGLI